MTMISDIMILTIPAIVAITIIHLISSIHISDAGMLHRNNNIESITVNFSNSMIRSSTPSTSSTPAPLIEKKQSKKKKKKKKKSNNNAYNNTNHPMEQHQHQHNHHHHQRQHLDHKQWSSTQKLEYSCIDNYNQTLSYPAIPSFIIAGAQKSGTSALYNILAAHPLLVSTSKFEAHFFDKTANQINSTSTEGEICRKGYEYYQYFNLTSSQDGLLRSSLMYAYEKTPSYLLNPNIPEMILKTCPWKPKIIVILRNPIDRAYSHHKMDQHRGEKWHNLTHVIFEEKLVQDYEELKKVGILAGSLDAPEIGIWNGTASSSSSLKNNTLLRGFYSEQLKPWLRHFKIHDEIMVIPYETFQKNRLDTFHSILQFIGVPRLALSVTEEQLAVNLGPTPKAPVSNSSLSKETRDILGRLYKPYNDDLVDLLGVEWKDIWN